MVRIARTELTLHSLAFTKGNTDRRFPADTLVQITGVVYAMGTNTDTTTYTFQALSKKFRNAIGVTTASKLEAVPTPHPEDAKERTERILEYIERLLEDPPEPPIKDVVVQRPPEAEEMGLGPRLDNLRRLAQEARVSTLDQVDYLPSW